MSNNFLTDIHNNLFSPTQKLKGLYISMTMLRSLDFLLHANLTELEMLQVAYNTFSVIREPVMLSLPALTYLDMQGNGFTCNCDNAWFLQWVITDLPIGVSPMGKSFKVTHTTLNAATLQTLKVENCCRLTSVLVQ